MFSDITLVCLLLGIAVLFFSFNVLEAEIIALGLMLSFVLCGILTPGQAFSGFASDTVMMIMGLLIMTTALTQTGAMEGISRWVRAFSSGRPFIFLLLLLTVTGFLSSFISNTATIALLTPMAVVVCRKMNFPVSKILLPMAFVSILAGTVTLIGTSTNLVVSGLMTTLGMEALDMFELSPVGLVILGSGFLYLVLIGRHMISTPKENTDMAEVIRSSNYLTEMILLESSPMAGKTLRDLKFGEANDLQVIRLVREGNRRIHVNADLALAAGDILLVEGAREAILDIQQKAGIEILAQDKLGIVEGADPDSERVVEALVLPRPGLQGRTLKQTRFHEKYGVIVLGLRRHGNIFFRKMSQVSLATGDLLLLRGATQDLRSLEDEGFLKLLYEADRPKNSLRRGLVAGAIFVISLSLGIAKIITLPMAALLGAFLMLATKCASPRETFREMEWKAVILIACMLSVGTALTTSRADQAIGSAIVTWGGSLPAIVLMGGVFVLTVALSQPMSNQAAAALILPVAVQIAVQLGLDPRPFAITVALAASCSFLTPLEPACLLVYGPGGYRFKDFFIVGFPLTLLMLAITLWLVPKWWPLTV